ncbi:MAG: M48 family metalloprotease, partial [Thermoanaerobaculia bacterium]|nr:M48 family metalloprotease [Thermoanaerobaculia bacterium]
YLTVAAIMMGSIVLLADLGVRWMFWGGRRRTSSDRAGGAQAALLAVSLLLMILAPILAHLLYFALSRRREYLADASAAVYTRYPAGLADALEKIAGSTERLRAANRTTAPMYIVNPLKVTGSGLADLTSTHPPTSERVRILRSMAGGEIGWASYDAAYQRVSGRPVGVVPAGSIAAAEAAAERAPREDARSHLERVRGVTDALWQMQSYVFIACACGTELKVPPAHRGRTIPCPHCGRPHGVRERSERAANRDAE